MKTIRSLVVASTLFVAGQAQAASSNINIPTNFGQAQYNALSNELGAATWMTPSNSAESHSSGIIPVGVQAAVEFVGVSIDSNLWASAGANKPPSRIFVPRLRVSAGIPFGLDVGVMITKVPNSNIKMTGFEGRMAFGNYIPVPMLEANVRYHQSSLTGIPDVKIKNTGYAAMIGANLPIVKPYIEIGTVTSTSTPSGALVSQGNLKEYQKKSTTKAIGAKIELALFVINVEKAKVGDKDLLTAKFGFEF